MEQSILTGRQKSAEGKVARINWETRKERRPERQKNQLVLAFPQESRSEAPTASAEGTESFVAKHTAESPAIGEQRTRTYGGVTGTGGDRLPISIATGDIRDLKKFGPGLRPVKIALDGRACPSAPKEHSWRHPFYP